MTDRHTLTHHAFAWLPLGNLRFGPRVWLTLLALATALPASARREPTPGGQLTVSLPEPLARQTAAAHLFVPVVKPVFNDDARAARAHPPLRDFPAWQSNVITELKKGEGGRRWTFRTPNAAAVARAVSFCLGAQGDGEDWPAVILRGAGKSAELTSSDDVVTVSFDGAVGVLPELLSGCHLRGASATGTYRAGPQGVLLRRDEAPGGPPLLARILFSEDTKNAQFVADAVPGAGTSLVSAPYPDVIVLVPSEKARARDPFDLGTGKDRGLVAFRSELRPEVLAGIYTQGRGGPAEGLLPPGLAPPRPLPEPAVPGRPLALTLEFIDDSAETITMRLHLADPLLDGVADRLAVMLRTRGLRLLKNEALASPEGPVDETEIALERFRSPTPDPALAMLFLAGRYPARLGQHISPKQQRALLSGNTDERLEAAVLQERAWLSERRIIPVMVADRVFTVDSALYGVKIRGDGVPLLDRAYWGAAR